jgi:hypothetical protein
MESETSSGPSRGRLLPGGALQGGGLANPAAVAPVVSRPWVSLTFHDLAPHAEAGLERFRLEAIQPVRGARPPEWKAGMSITRREFSGLRGPDADALQTRCWSGLIDTAHSTTPEQAAQLARSWQHNPFRVALVIAFKHVPRFWTLSPEERAFDHCGFPDRAGIQRSPILRKVIRHLQWVAAPDVGGGDWDTLAQFEMLPEHVAHLREHLAERRELALLSNLVEREVELWMVKSLDHHGNSAPNPASGA